MRYNYCPKCGNKLIAKQAGDDGDVPFCEECQEYWFDSFASCVIVLVYNEFQEVVLSRQGYISDTYASFTSGFMSPGETAEETAVREVKEEIGLDVQNLEYAGTYWFGAREQLLHGFIAYSPKSELNLSQEVDDAKWISVLDAPKYMFPESPGNAAYGIYRKYLKKLQI